MDPGLSDLLICPRCGPSYGLILLPDERQDRRVVRGVLGCANCRERYPVEDGVADLRVPHDAGDAAVASGVVDGRASTGLLDGFVAAGAAAGAATDAATEVEPGTSVWAVPGEEPVRLAALLGLDEARGTILVAGPAAAFAPEVAQLSNDAMVVGAGVPGSVPQLGERVSRVRASTVLPFRSGSLAAVALTGGYAGLVEEAVRVLKAGGRLLVEPAPSDPPDSWDDAMEVLARERAAFLGVRT